MEKTQKLGEKIYFLTYGKPRYKAEISQLLYGEEKKTIYPVIKKLVKKKWIRRDYLKKTKKKCLGDGRAVNRKYFLANVEPLFENICNDMKRAKVELNDNEKQRLKKVLDSPSFRNIITKISEDYVYTEEITGINKIRKVNEPTEEINGFHILTEMIFTTSVLLSFMNNYLKSNLKKLNKKTTEEFLRELMDRYELETDKDVKEMIFALGLPLTIKLAQIDIDEMERRHDDFDRIVRFMKTVHNGL